MLVVPPFLLRPSTLAPRLRVPVVTVPVVIVVDGVFAPITVFPFPSMKTLQPEWLTGNPDITRSQIKILIPNDANVFVTVPDVTVRNRHRARRRRRGNHHGRRSNHDRSCECHPAIRLDDTAR
jgi:hypothetical protein